MKEGRCTASSVSFGTVATVEYDVYSADLLPTSIAPARKSVEEYERSRRLHKPLNLASPPTAAKASARNCFVQLQCERALQLETLRCEIEESIKAADTIIRSNSTKDGIAPMLSLHKRHGGRPATMSFPPPGKPPLRRPRTRSISRLSNLHLSRLNLNQGPRKQDGDESPAFFESMKNAQFDTIPKRPTRKRSSESLVKQKFLDVMESANAANAVWESSERPKKKLSPGRDCIPKISHAMNKGATLDNSTRRHSNWRASFIIQGDSPRNL